MSEQTTAWPCGCKDRGSCERHRRCMYAGCNHRQREIASQIDAAIERLRAEQAEEQARRAELSNVLREPYP